MSKFISFQCPKSTRQINEQFTKPCHYNRYNRFPADSIVYTDNKTADLNLTALPFQEFSFGGCNRATSTSIIGNLLGNRVCEGVREMGLDGELEGASDVRREQGGRAEQVGQVAERGKLEGGGGF